MVSLLRKSATAVALVVVGVLLPSLATYTRAEVSSGTTAETIRSLTATVRTLQFNLALLKGQR
jgi:hypothetical protein